MFEVNLVIERMFRYDVIGKGPVGDFRATDRKRRRVVVVPQFEYESADVRKC